MCGVRRRIDEAIWYRGEGGGWRGSARAWACGPHLVPSTTASAPSVSAAATPQLSESSYTTHSLFYPAEFLIHKGGFTEVRIIQLHCAREP